MGEMGKRELAAVLATSSGDGGFERRQQGLARARAREMGKRRNRWAGRSVIWLSVNVWRIMRITHIMRNMRHAYLTLSQITRPSTI
jgi:hypothetical protein